MRILYSILTNPGVQHVNIDSIIFSSPSFSLYNEVNGAFDVFEVWYYNAEMLAVYFAPTENQVNEGTMTIYSDDPNNPECVINLAGNSTSGVSEQKLSNASVYPNPASSIVYLKYRDRFLNTSLYFQCPRKKSILWINNQWRSN